MMCRPAEFCLHKQDTPRVLAVRIRRNTNSKRFDLGFRFAVMALQSYPMAQLVYSLHFVFLFFSHPCFF